MNNTGRLFKDDVIVIQSAMTKQEGNREARRELVRSIIDETNQLAIFVSHAGGDVDIIE